MIEGWKKFVKITYENDLSQLQKNEKFKEMESLGINVQVLRDAAQARRDTVKIQGNLYPEIMLTGEGDKSDAIKISVLAGLTDRYMIHDKDGSYHLESGKKSGIRINSGSGLTFKNPTGLVSGKISHSDRYGDTAEFNQAVSENELYELFPYLSEYRIVKPVAEIEPEKKIEVLSTPVQPEQDTQEQKNLDVQAKQIIENVSTHSEEAASDAKTFIQKVKDNWHNLSEKVKSYFKSLSEKLKRLVGIK